MAIYRIYAIYRSISRRSFSCQRFHYWKRTLRKHRLHSTPLGSANLTCLHKATMEFPAYVQEEACNFKPRSSRSLFSPCYALLCAFLSYPLSLCLSLYLFLSISVFFPIISSQRVCVSATDVPSLPRRYSPTREFFPITLHFRGITGIDYGYLGASREDPGLRVIQPTLSSPLQLDILRYHRFRLYTPELVSAIQNLRWSR